VNSGEGESGKKKCTPALEDYYECLHHRKEVCLES
jgi:NADH dehydrogenase (ubiquinone) Fe-S protein 5